MKPLNEKERNDLFIKWFAVFVITVILVLVAAYFDFELPNEHYEVLQKNENAFKSFMDNEKRVTKDVDSSTAILSNYGKGYGLKSGEEITLQDFIAELKNMQSTDPAVNSLHQKIALLLQSSVDSRKRLANLTLQHYSDSLKYADIIESNRSVVSNIRENVSNMNAPECGPYKSAIVTRLQDIRIK